LFTLSFEGEPAIRKNMARSRTNSVAFLIGMLVLCVVPAQGQIVSYLDCTGKRVFINADPRPVAKPAKPSQPETTAAAKIPATGKASSAATSESFAEQQANRQKITDMIREVSARYRVDPSLVRAVIETESNWNSTAVSRKGALGLMQLYPSTAQKLGVNNAFDPKENLDGGVRYLHMLLERYNGDLDKALAAYNAGPGAVDRAGGIPRYRETRDYVQKVTDSYFQPGSNRTPRAFDPHRQIYRTVAEDGRVVFTNE
jgi:soluble lytic murein transglycosylase-like protein